MSLYENIDETLTNKLLVPMHYKIGVTMVMHSILCCNYMTV